MRDYPIKGPDLTHYLRAQKVLLPFRGMRASEFYSKFGFLSIRETLQEGRGGDPTYMARVAQCVFEQHWFESMVATVVGDFAFRLDLRNVDYSWRFLTKFGNWVEHVKLTGDQIVSKGDDEHEHETKSFKFEFTIPEVVSSDTARSLRPWLELLIAEFYKNGATEYLAETTEAANKAASKWQEHLASNNLGERNA